MLSPSSFAVPRQAPPVRPSRSLEGMERFIPPESPARPTPKLDKPLPHLPTKPLPATPSMECSTAWSDDSSTVESFESRRLSEESNDSYPVFVRSGSDDLELADHHRASAVEPYGKTGPGPAPSSLSFTTLPRDRNAHPPPWTPNPSRPNHYFREKKWDFFPELATPSALPPKSPRNQFTKPRKNGSLLNLAAFDFAKKGSRWNSSDRSGLAHDMRSSIKSLVQRRLSKHSVDKEKSKSKARPATAPDYVEHLPHTPRIPSSNYSDRDSTSSEMSSIDVNAATKRFSVSTRSSTEECRPREPIAFHRRKQLAVPISPYQTYGAAIWEKSGREKRISYRQPHHVRFPRYRKKPSPLKSAAAAASSPNNAAPLSPKTRSQLEQNTRDCVRALQDGTSHVLVALDGARKKMIGSRVDRRRMQLKSQIRLVGPVNPYNTHGKVDPWI